jgi:long-chain-fatty-acid--CoA ligase ACSBG
MDELAPLATADVTQEVRIRKGEGEMANAPAKTVMQNFDAVVEKHGSKPALHQKVVSVGKSAAETPWTSWTWKEYRENVDAFAKALLSLGFQRFDIINILGFNAPEWLFANFGAIAAGGVAAGIYATNNAEACKYISEHSKAKVVVCDGLRQLEKYYEISKDLPFLKALVMYGTDKLPADIKAKCSVPIYAFADFLKLGKDVADTDLKTASASSRPGETCTLIYTSGTTGPPKAVMITNDNITWTLEPMLLAIPKGYLDENDVMISYLPLSHIAAQMLDMHVPMRTGLQIYFAQADALKGSLGATLKDVRPTAFFGVPRVWEKIYGMSRASPFCSSNFDR